MNFGFIGCGNMAGAIIRGMVKGGVNPKSIFVFDVSKDALSALKEETGICAMASQWEVIESCDALLLGVKPNILSGILPSVKTDIGEKDILIISIAAGRNIEFYERYLGSKARIIRVMPNINAKVLASCSAYCPNANATPDDEKTVTYMFSKVGSITKLNEELFAIFGSEAGAAPAFCYMFIDSLARAAQMYGIPRDKALDIAANTVLGSAKMVLASKEHPIELMDKVCSPGGTTIEGVYSLKKDAFEAAVMRAVESSYLKDIKMQKA